VCASAMVIAAAVQMQPRVDRCPYLELPKCGIKMCHGCTVAARVRALEEKIPAVERPIRKYLPPGGELPSKAVGEGTLLSRVAALEHAMEALLRAQVWNGQSMPAGSLWRCLGVPALGNAMLWEANAAVLLCLLQCFFLLRMSRALRYLLCCRMLR
jgi:hypothetical protein